MLAEWAVLESERLRLRPLTVADLGVWHRVLFSDPEVTRYLPVRRPVSRARAAVRLRGFLETWEAHGVGVWAVTGGTLGRLCRSLRIPHSRGRESA